MVGLAPVNRNRGEHEILKIGAEAPEFPGLLRLIRRRHLGKCNGDVGWVGGHADGAWLGAVGLIQLSIFEMYFLRTLRQSARVRLYRHMP
jgi:hypothetical protein